MASINDNNESADDVSMDRSVVDYLAENNIRVNRNVVLSDITYMRTGGVAKTIAFPVSGRQMSGLVSILNKTDTPYKVIGATSNLLFLDDAKYTFLLCTADIKTIEYDDANQQIICDTGVMLPDLARFALYQSVDGFAGLEGIPGTLGGAVFMNAGAYGYEIKDTLTAVDIVTSDGTARRFAAEELGLSYRTSVLKKKELQGIVTRCYFSARQGDAEKIAGEMELYHAKRHKYQDFLYPNLGSLFSGSPYRSMAKKDKYFKYVSAAYLLFMYKLKIHRRESPINRKWLNDIAVKRFHLEYDLQPFSNKTINCLVNRGQGTDEMVRFIEEMKELTENSIPLENEIVQGF